MTIYPIPSRRLPRAFVPSLLLVVTLALLFSSTRIAAAQGETHVIQPGDTLTSIAARYGVTVAALAEANHIVNPNLIFVGQVLSIPGETADEPPAAEPPPDQPPTAMTEHVVRPGDTLSRIAVRYGVTVQALLNHNNLVNPNVIFVGQRLRVPAAALPSAGSEPPPASPAYKQIVVDKSEQRAYVYQNGQLLWQFVISTGMPGSDTWEGVFHVRSKIPNAYAYNWGLQMPYWLGFYHTGYLENGFHALPILPSGAILWEGYLGTPVSYGCVILSYADAETLYNWAEIGTEVVVQK